MKKTIAILLILVIGMVGVFAGTGATAPENNLGSTVKLRTTIDPMFNIKVTNTIVNPWTTSGWDGTDYSIEDTYADVNTDIKTEIGYVHTRSNASTGYAVSVTAGLLKDEDKTLYLAYILSVEDVADISVGTTTAADPVEIFEIESLGELSYENRQLHVTIPTYETAAAGTYIADIAFNITAD